MFMDICLHRWEQIVKSQLSRLDKPNNGELEFSQVSYISFRDKFTYEFYFISVKRGF